MNRTRKTLITILFSFASATALWAQSGPAISVENLNCRYKQTAASLQEIDFRNIILRPDCADLSSEEAYKLRDGKFEQKEQPYGGSEVELGDVLIPRLQGLDRHVVIAFNVLRCGGSCSEEGYVQVIALLEGYPTIIQQLRFDSQAEGTGNWFNTKTGTLRIVARSNDGSAHCCPEHIDEAWFALENGKFVLKSWKQLSIK